MATRRPSRRLGLRGRLALSIVAIVFAAFAVTFIAVYRGTGSELRTRIDSELRAEVDGFQQRVARTSGTPATIAAAARSYIAAQPFGPTARLLIIAVRGGRIVTNHPELAGVVREHEGDSPADRRRELAQAKTLLSAPTGFSTLDLVDAGEVRVLTRVATHGRRSVAVVRSGEPLATVNSVQSDVARTFLIAGAVTLAAALLAAYVLAARTAAPLRRMARVAAAVDAGELSHRIGTQGPSEEVQSLAESFDHMLDRLEDAFSRQREFVSDASHELRTPLTAIRGQLEVLARQKEPAAMDVRRVQQLVGVEMARVERLIDDLLMLARLDEGAELRHEPIEPGAYLRELLGDPVVGNGVELGAVPTGTLRADPDRLAQVLRNLLRNARQHAGADGLVRVSGRCANGSIVIEVEDDGPGIPVSQRGRIFDRFYRVETSRPRESGGSGLGLAIARAIIELHGGRIWAGESWAGGACVAFELPGFTLHVPPP
jgi:two-component system, OmpR family, sensor kinase